MTDRAVCWVKWHFWNWSQNTIKMSRLCFFYRREHFHCFVPESSNSFCLLFVCEDLVNSHWQLQHQLVMWRRVWTQTGVTRQHHSRLLAQMCCHGKQKAGTHPWIQYKWPKENDIPQMLLFHIWLRCFTPWVLLAKLVKHTSIWKHNSSIPKPSELSYCLKPV